jgi:hypothetical protein
MIHTWRSSFLVVRPSCFLFFHCHTITWKTLVPLMPSLPPSPLFLSMICHALSSIIIFPAFALLSLHTLFSTIFFWPSNSSLQHFQAPFVLLNLLTFFIMLFTFYLCVLILWAWRFNFVCFNTKSLSMFHNQQITLKKKKVKLQVLFWVVASWAIYHKLHKGIFISFIFYSSYSFTLFCVCSSFFATKLYVDICLMFFMVIFYVDLFMLFPFVHNKKFALVFSFFSCSASH